MPGHCVRNCIIPPYIFDALLESKDRKLRELARTNMIVASHMRAQRGVLALLPSLGTPAGEKRRTIYDAKNAETDPPHGALVRGEGDPAASDPSVNEAYDGLGVTYDFYRTVFGRNSLDGNGLRLDAVVHYGRDINNAFWDGQRMVFGDGDGERFTHLTGSLDVIAHELTHGVTEFAAGFEYHNESGALNESMSDVFGSLVKQWALGQQAASADWLIGAEIFTPGTGGDALRSLKAPGEAFNSPIFGKDPQPRSMKYYKRLPDTRAGDWGGVHINSGIPNHAFYWTAIKIGGHAWEAPGRIWYETLTKNSGPQADFQDFADATVGVAGRLYGPGSREQQAVRDAWQQVDIQVTGVGSIKAGGPALGARSNGRGDDAVITELRDAIAALGRRLDELTAGVG
jgi:Zn-dependent metalloprotease